jgi:CHAD domain-containing protein
MATTTTEVERKYDVPPDFAVPDLTAVPGITSVDGPELLRLDATYYDTADLDLTRNHLTLRRRTGGHDAGWHLKRPSGADRTETTEPLTRSRAVPSSLADELRPVIGAALMAPIARIRNQRREWTVRDANGTALALIADDTVTATALAAPPQTRSWRELEVELSDGPRELLDAIESQLREAGARRSTSPSKLAQALGDRYPASRPAAHGRGARAVEAYLDEHRAAVRDNLPLVCSGDPDGVHDMRVAVRRLRSTLRTLRPVLDRDRTEPLRAELHWLAGCLGAVRDDDVLRRRLTHDLDTLVPDSVLGPIHARIDERLTSHAAGGREELDAALNSARYGDLMRSLDSVAVPHVKPAKLLHLTRKALQRADRRLKPARKATGIDQDTGLHDARKAYKRARYAVELVEPIAGEPAARLATRLRALQDVLGDHQDAVVARRLVRDLGVRAHLDGENAFTYGLMYAREAAAARHSLAALDKTRRRARKPRGWL